MLEWRKQWEMEFNAKKGNVMEFSMSSMRQKGNYSMKTERISKRNKLNAEVINARNIHDFKTKLDNSRYGDGTVRA